MSDNDQVTGQQDFVQDVQDQEQEVTSSEPMPSSEELVTTDELVDEDRATRTGEQFEKLLESNRQLKDELDAVKRATSYGQSVLDTTGVDYPQEPQYADDYVDPISRELREVRETVRDLAEDKRRKMVEEAHAKHPYLDPKGKDFDPHFYELTRDRLARYMIQGQRPSMSAVADEIASFYKPAITPEKVEEAKKTAVEEDRKTRQDKVLVSQPAQSSAKRENGPDEAELRARTRNGDPDAFAERLRRAGL